MWYLFSVYFTNMVIADKQNEKNCLHVSISAGKVSKVQELPALLMQHSKKRGKKWGVGVQRQFLQESL